VALRRIAPRTDFGYGGSSLRVRVLVVAHADLDPPSIRGSDVLRWFEGAPDAYLILSPDLTIVGVNDAYLAATHTTRDGIVGRPLFEVFPDNPDDPNADGVRNLRASLERVLETRAPHQMATQKYDITMPHGGFEERHWSPINTPLLDRRGNVAWILHRAEDVTERVRLKIPVTHAELAAYARKTEERLVSTEEQLRQAQKLEAVGRLAGGIAHDFNNLLSVILTSVGFLRTDLGATGPIGDDLKEIEDAGRRAADLTRRLLAFSRQQVLDPRVLEPAAVVRGIQPMLARLLGEDIEQRVRVAPGAGCVRADWSQLEQVVLNLVVNARDAMPEGGLLGIEVSNVALTEAYSASHAEVPPGEYVLLTVSDTGIGMDRQTQERAFEPFFTTKPPGLGTGLGLSTVFGIVRQSGGFVWLYSEPGIGTTFKIYLPRVSERPDAVASEVKGTARGGDESVLVLEDDEAVRGAVVRILTRLGYKVTATEHAVEALAQIALPGETPDLLITDVVMPEMNGRQVAERAAAIAPKLKVLYISGYTDDVVLQHGILARGVAYLSKPITPEALGRKVREVLGTKV
jgi:signal transduction histidine kinase/CheY-like chemotaxis protein